MKIYIRLYLIVVGLVLIACEKAKLTTEIVNQDTIIIGTGNVPGEFLCPTAGDGIASDPGPLACLTIVKFYNPELLDKVIIQHPFKKYNGIEGSYEYLTDAGLYLNILPDGYTWENGCGLATSIINWADGEMHITGTSPYIPLTDGYYLIDWKWHQLYPLSAIANTFPNAYHDHFDEHIRNHCFITDLDWKNTTDLTEEYKGTQTMQSVKGVEILRIWTLELACFNGEIYTGPYVWCYGGPYYEDGLSITSAYAYHISGDCSHSGKTHHTYIDICDSLQSVYQQWLIEIINNGQLKEIGY